MAFNPAPAAERMANFKVHSPSYKTIAQHSLVVDILVPKDLKTGPRPIIVRFHGGFLVTGSSMFLGIWPPWLLDYAAAQSAITVSPNYRKLPESNGTDLVEDLDAFWSWMARDLQKEVTLATTEGVKVDLNKVMVIGQSAGGYLAALSAFRQPSAGMIRALILAYPMLDMKSPWFAQAYEKHPMGRPTMPAAMVDEHIAATKPGTLVIVPEDLLARRELAVAIVQQGRYPEFLGTKEEFYPMELLNNVHSFPPLFIYHGLEDTAVSVDGTRDFVDKLRQSVRGAKVVMKLEHGDHGDTGLKPNLEGGWMREGLGFIELAWL